MLNTPNYSPEEIRQNLKPGDMVDCFGQPCKVIIIDRGEAHKDTPVFVENKLARTCFWVPFDVINDITNTCSQLSSILQRVKVVGRQISIALKD